MEKKLEMYPLLFQLKQPKVHVITVKDRLVRSYRGSYIDIKVSQIS